MSSVKKWQIIDTHCHVQFEQYDADREAVIRRALDAGVGMICVGTDAESSRRAISLAEQYEGVWATVGIHPNDLGEFREVERFFTHPKVVAVGEVGLDYYRTTDPLLQKKQRELLGQFLTIDKPRIIHCRDGSTSLTTGAHEDLLKMLPPGKGVIHSFTGTKEQAAEYIRRGYVIGFNGIITFARQYDDVVQGIPLDRILLETDSPYLAPASHRGKRNEPSYIVEVARRIADLHRVSIDEVIAKTTANASYIFSIM